MDKLDNGLDIYSISFGNNPVDSMKWHIKQLIHGKKGDLTEYRVSAIVFDEAHFFHYGETSYAIYVNNGTDNILWRKYVSVPVSITYDL